MDGWIFKVKILTFFYLFVFCAYIIAVSFFLLLLFIIFESDVKVKIVVF